MKAPFVFISVILVTNALMMPAQLLAQDISKVAVMPLAPLKVDPETVEILDEILTIEVARHGEFSVISRKDIDAMLGMERMKEVLGCDDLSCAVEISGALGVDYMITGSIGRLGSKLFISLALFDSRAMKVIKRIRQSIPANEDLYEQGLVTAVGQLFGRTTTAALPMVAPPAQPGPIKETQPETNTNNFNLDPGSQVNEEPFYQKWWFWTAVGATVITIVLISTASSDAQAAMDAFGNSNFDMGSGNDNMTPTPLIQW